MKQIYIILISLLYVSTSLSTAFAQNKITANSATEIPAEVSQWIKSELAKAKRKTLMDFEAGEFFVPDTARLIGYIKGYCPQAGFSTGMIYACNEVTREDFPVIVQIHEDGRFESAIPMNYPKYTAVVFNDSWIQFYIQPGQTLAMLLNLEDLQKYVRYQGTTGDINNELMAFNTQLPDIPYGDIFDGMQTKTPEEFKPFLDSCLADYSQTYQQLLGTAKLSEQSKTILQNNYQITYAMQLSDYQVYRQNTKQIPLEYYDFLQDIPMNNKELLSTKDFSIFINRFEYCPPLLLFIALTDEEVLLEERRLQDSIYTNVLKLKPGIVYDVTKIRSLNFVFGLLKDNKEAARNVLTTLVSDIPESFLRSEADRLFLKNFPEEQREAYELPDTYEAKIFKDLIAPFKGKFLLVDFWATSCGPCVYNIKQHKALREQYKDSPDIDFIFITSENESPLQRYNEFVAEQELKNTYRINADQYRYLRQLFRFNGIPRYVLVDKEGRILDDNYDARSNLDTKLEELTKK